MNNMGKSVIAYLVAPIKAFLYGLRYPRVTRLMIDDEFDDRIRCLEREFQELIERVHDMDGRGDGYGIYDEEGKS